MYVRKVFRPPEEAALDLVRDLGFGMVMTLGAEEPLCTHLPFVVKESDQDQLVLEGHVARANPHWKALGDDASVLCVFTGPHAYISNRWYDFENVPTWNYAVVHLHGSSRLFESEGELLAHLEELMNRHEPRGTASERTGEPPAALVQKLLPAIVGFRIQVSKIEARFKLSQDKDPPNFRSVIEHLEARAEGQDRAVAALMREARPEHEL